MRLMERGGGGQGRKEGPENQDTQPIRLFRGEADHRSLNLTSRAGCQVKGGLWGPGTQKEQCCLWGVAPLSGNPRPDNRGTRTGLLRVPEEPKAPWSHTAGRAFGQIKAARLPAVLLSSVSSLSPVSLPPHPPGRPHPSSYAPSTQSAGLAEGKVGKCAAPAGESVNGRPGGSSSLARSPTSHRCGLG